MTFNDEFPLHAGPLPYSALLFNDVELLTVFDIFKLETTKYVFDLLIQIRSHFCEKALRWCEYQLFTI